MARKTSELLSAFGTMWEIAKVIVHAVLDLGGNDEDVKKILAKDSDIPKRIAEVVMGVAAKTTTVRDWPIWKTIQLGTHKSVDDFYIALERCGNKVSGWARDLLGKITLAKEVMSVDLVLTTPYNLGFNRNATTTELVARARERGLVPCPAEVGVALREQYQDQPVGERLWIMMEPISARTAARTCSA